MRERLFEDGGEDADKGVGRNKGLIGRGCHRTSMEMTDFLPHPSFHTGGDRAIGGALAILRRSFLDTWVDSKLEKHEQSGLAQYTAARSLRWLR